MVQFELSEEQAESLRKLNLPPMIYADLVKNVKTGNISGVYIAGMPVMKFYQERSYGSQFPVATITLTDSGKLDYIILNKKDFDRIQFVPRTKYGNSYCVEVKGKIIHIDEYINCKNPNGRNFTGNPLFD